MPSSQSKGYFLELNDSFLLVARTVTPGRPTVIEEMREASLDNKTAVSQALEAVFPASGPATLGVVCSVRPRDRFFLLAPEKDTPKASSLAALRTLVGNSPFAAAGPSELVGIDTRSGMPLEGKPGSRWFVSGAPKESLAGVRATLGEWKVAPSRMEVATVGFLGVVLAEQQKVKGAPTLVWEVGDTTSDLFLVGAHGIENVKRVPFGLDRVADGVQAELGMKSRGAATRIFFNEFYDFSEVGPKIAGRLAASLQPAINEIANISGNPSALICTGLASKQSWFCPMLAKALNLSLWGPDLTTWCNSAGLTFVGNTLQTKLSPTWFGLLGMMSAIPADRPETESAWHPGWSVDGIEREEKPRPVPVLSTPEPAPAPTPARPASATPAPKIVPPSPALFAATPTARPAATPSPSKPAPKTPGPAVTSTSVAARQEVPVRPAAQAAAPKAAAAPSRPAPAAASPTSAEAAAATVPASRPVPAAKPPTATATPPESRSFLKTPAFLAIIGVLVVVLALGAFFYHKFAQQQAASAAAQHQAEQLANAEKEARQKAEIKAKADAELLKRTEEELARKNAAAESLAKKAAEEAKQREIDANRLLNGRGSVVIVTEPAGASVAISNFAPRLSPATVKDLRLGRYTVEITMAGYESVSLEVEVKENEATNPGVVRLVRQSGTLEVASEPAGTTYEVRPAPPRITFGGKDVKTGKTPATIADLPTGDYVVTFQREGWPVHSENVTVEHGKTARVVSKFTGGTVTITSSPSAARVTRNGEAIGETPLTLNDQLPGDVTYSLDLAGFMSATVQGKIEPEKTLTLSAELDAEDRIVPLRELDERPVPIKMVQPDVGYEEARNGGTALISLVVDRDGTPKDLKVESSSDASFAQRCMTAAKQWRFKPGSIKGVPVRTRVSVPFKL
jgi:TonB family protein